MRIVEALTINNQILAYCVGEDLPIDFNCSKIKVAGKVLNVLKSGTSIAFCGKKNALLALDVRKESDVPIGTFTIIQ